MIGPHWVLITEFLFNDGHVTNKKEILYKKEYCIEMGKIRWREFFQNEMDTVSTHHVVCRNEINNYDFVPITCDKAGNCNI